MLAPHQLGLTMTRFIADHEEDMYTCENCKADFINDFGEFYWLFCPMCGKKIMGIVEDPENDDDDE